MADSIKITLDSQAYNAIYGLNSTFAGEKSKIIGVKVMDLIREAVVAGTKDDVNPETIVVDFPKKYLDGIYVGVTEVIKKPEVTTTDVLNLKSICQVLKMKNRFDTLVEKELESLPESEDAFDDEMIDEPFDGE